MDGTDTLQYLDELWVLHASRGDRLSLCQYLEEFVATYKVLLNYDVSKAQKNTLKHTACISLQSDGSITLDHFPSKLLQMMQTHLLRLQDQISTNKTCDVKLAAFLVKALTIISRTHNHSLFNLSSIIVGNVLIISLHVVSLLRVNSTDISRNVADFQDFLACSFQFFESLYDPYFMWRKSLAGIKINDETSAPVPLINAEVIPFFYESLQLYSSNLSTKL
jgi:hypothetical protein